MGLCSLPVVWPEVKLWWGSGITGSVDMSLRKLWEGDDDGQGSLACCIPWDRKELDTTE